MFTDVEEYDATEKEPQISLADFILSLSTVRYFITNDSSTVYAYDYEKDCERFCYHNEELMVETLPIL